ncbi:glutaminyl-peptide cyclotransferase [Winogradskyella sp. 3972H.M.0a.05]|uniref:glutaminyl-peptide cyclotransferase n=1 Tax=Winogradskyella sp. 3972H.M.0a.05 TaxID=2950277 RepID=UPI003393682F
MPFLKYFFTISLTLLLFSCGGNSSGNKTNFRINTNAKGNKVVLGEALNLSISNPKNLDITKTEFKLGDAYIDANATLEDVKLGKQTITAIVHYDDNSEVVKTTLTVLNNQQPKVLNFEIINEYPHDITSYTQGLEFHDGQLYESTGQYGESKLRMVDYKTGDVLKNIDLSDSFFGEGLTILNNNIYQLTWKEGTGFIYDLASFEKTSSFKYGKSKEGWGICNDGTSLYKSDGTENIWTLNVQNLTEGEFIQVYTNKGKIPSLNELEWIDGKIYANIYQRNGVAIINPSNGAVEAVIDFTPLKNKVKQHAGLDVLNGIAYNTETGTIFVTGKRWDKLFEVKIVE